MQAKQLAAFFFYDLPLAFAIFLYIQQQCQAGLAYHEYKGYDSGKKNSHLAVMRLQLRQTYVPLAELSIDFKEQVEQQILFLSFLGKELHSWMHSLKGWWWTLLDKVMTSVKLCRITKD